MFKTPPTYWDSREAGAARSIAKAWTPTGMAPTGMLYWHTCTFKNVSTTPSTPPPRAPVVCFVNLSNRASTCRDLRRFSPLSKSLFFFLILAVSSTSSASRSSHCRRRAAMFSLRALSSCGGRGCVAAAAAAVLLRATLRAHTIESCQADVGCHHTEQNLHVATYLLPRASEDFSSPGFYDLALSRCAQASRNSLREGARGVGVKVGPGVDSCIAALREPANTMLYS